MLLPLGCLNQKLQTLSVFLFGIELIFLDASTTTIVAVMQPYLPYSASSFLFPAIESCLLLRIWQHNFFQEYARDRNPVNIRWCCAFSYKELEGEFIIRYVSYDFFGMNCMSFYIVKLSWCSHFFSCKIYIFQFCRMCGWQLTS